MNLRCPSSLIAFPRRPLLMGIVNINDDSFSGDGSLDPEVVIAQAKQLIADGADIIDIGAESARTNREAISVTEEVGRLRSFMANWEEIRTTPTKDEEQLSPPLLSVNTWRPEVVEQILGSGVDILNDMSALPDDQNARLCAKHNIPLLIMHSVGEPKVSHTHQQWPNLMASMTTFFEEKIALALSAGLTKEQIIIDPGIDFAKQKEDNLTLLRELGQLHQFGCPILLPISRKTVIGDVLDLPDPSDRDAGSIALLAHGMIKGAHIFRVHNVKSCWQSAKVLHPLTQGLPT
ncbi:MAG: dihydropteroate synthase [Verrucomicrobiaceae bacterium]